MHDPPTALAQRAGGGGYRVELAPAAQKELRKLPAPVRRRLAGPITGLARNPHPSGSRKLRGSTQTWRIRVGPYHIVYDIHTDRLLVVILKVVRRSESTYS